MSPAKKLLSVLLLLLPFQLLAQTPVGSDAPTRTITLTLAAGTLDQIKVLTQGAEKFDFALAPGGTCTAGQSYLAGQTCTVNLAFHPLYPGRRHGAVVLLPRSGPPLAQQFVAATATGSVNVFVPGTITTVAGNQNWIFAGDGQPATATNIFLPFGLAVDAAGNLYLADSSNNRVRKADALTQVVSTLAGNGDIGSTGDGGQATAASLSNPSSVLLDPAGNLYFSDSGNNAIRRVDAITGILSTVAGTLSHHGFSGDGGLATAATLNTPNGIALDDAANLYIADTGNHVIRRVDAVTGIITTVAGTGVAGYNGDSLPATTAQLNSPWSVTVGPGGELYIADQNNHRVRFVSLSGTISTLAGTGTSGYSGDENNAGLAQLNSPASVALDAAGNLYIADSGNNRIRKINPHDGTIRTVAGINSESFSGDLGPADQAGLYGPYTLALDGADNLFIADVFHNRIRKVASNQVSVKFPAIRVGRVSDPIKQTVENDGNAPLTIASLSPLQHSAVDPASTTCSPSTPLLPLDTCVVGVEFAPTVTGVPVVGKLAVNSDAGNSPGLIVPSGTVLDIDPTTLTLASSANPAITGATLTFTATATSAGSTPTGNVTFTDVYTDANGNQTTIALGATTLGNGSAAVSTATLAAGQHSITASYAGDASNASATSKALVEVVKDAQAPTVTTLASSASPVDAGAALILTATVATKTQGAGSFPIAGSVAFISDGNTIGTAPIDSTMATLDRATATFLVSNLPIGSHSIVAAYAGTANDTPSSSQPLTQAVRIATVKLGLTPSANPTVAGGPLTLTAAATSTGGTPTGTVSYAANGNPIGTALLNGQGIAVLQLTSVPWAPGNYTLTAAYAGDAADSAAQSQPVAEAVTIAGSVLTLATSLNPAGQGAQVVFTATAGSNGGTPSGVVTFSDSGQTLGTATLSAAGIASFSTTTLSIGAHSVTASYAGDAFDSPATSSPIAQQVDAATIGITLGSSKSPALFADSVTLTASVTGSGSAPTGTVTFFDAGAKLGSVPVDAAGHATWVTNSMSLGDHSMTAAYGGDNHHSPVTSSIVTQVIQQSTVLTLQPSSAHSVAGLPITLRATVNGAQGQSVTGSVTIADGATTLTTQQPDAAGLVSFTWQPGPGVHSISATYAGDHANAASAAPAQTVQVDLATTATTLNISANPVPFGTPLTFLATVSGNGATPGGSVTFSDGATPLATTALTSNGTASLTLTSLAPGIHALAAVYNGDTNDSASQAPAQSVQVALHTTLQLTSSANPALLGDPVTLSLFAANGSVAPPTGTITVTDNGTPLSTIALVNGSAQLTLPNPTLGTHTLAATFSGDQNNGPATATPLALSVTLRPSLAALTASSSTLGAGQPLVLVAVIQAQGSRTLTGTVTFQSGATVLGSGQLNASGVATLTLTPPPGVLNITVHYGGDSLYSPSTSVAVAVSVGPPDAFAITPTPAILSLHSGEHADSTIALVSNPAFHDQLAFGCAGLPAYATCHFSSDLLDVNPGVPQSLTVTIDTGNPLGIGASAATSPAAWPLSGGHNGPLACFLPAAALLAFALRRKRRVLLALTALLLSVVIGSTTGCATQFSQSTTAAGDYSVQVVATGTATHTTQTATIHVTVTK